MARLACVAGGTAALAAAMLARPDRSARWVLLPLPPLVLWFGSLGWGCLADLAAAWPDGHAARHQLGVPQVHPRPRHPAGRRRSSGCCATPGRCGPGRCWSLGGLASAALCSAGLSLFHHLDAAVMILLWHGGAMALLTLLGWLLGRPVLWRRPVGRATPQHRA